MGGEVKIFDPAGLPLADSEPETHPKVQDLRKLAAWAEGMIWCSPERHGAMTGIMKTQIDSPMATPNCSTYGQSNCSRQNVADYDYSGVTAMRAAASFRR